MVDIKPKLNTIYKISDKISLIGTSHLDKTSSQKVAEIIQQLHPHVVMVELDAEEYQTYLEENASTSVKKTKRPSAEKSDFLEVLYNTQQAFGDLIHITPASELIAAVDAAKRLDINVKFIDLPFRITAQRIQVVQSKIQQEQAQLTDQIHQQEFNEKEIQSFLSQMQNADVIDQMVMEMKRQFPELYRVLLTDRNEYMTDQLWQYHVKNPADQLLIVVGGAHVRELISLIQKKLTLSK